MVANIGRFCAAALIVIGMISAAALVVINVLRLLPPAAATAPAVPATPAGVPTSAHADVWVGRCARDQETLPVFLTLQDCEKHKEISLQAAAHLDSSMVELVMSCQCVRGVQTVPGSLAGHRSP